MRWLALGVLCLGICNGAFAQDARWVTFRSLTNDWGLIQDQIDRQTVRQEGPYRTFWTRRWRVQKKEPLVASYYGSLIFWSQKFAVDCSGRKFGRDLIDSNLPSERRRKIGFDRMRWQALGRYPGMEKAVCGR